MVAILISQTFKSGVIHNQLYLLMKSLINDICFRDFRDLEVGECIYPLRLSRTGWLKYSIFGLFMRKVLLQNGSPEAGISCN